MISTLDRNLLEEQSAMERLATVYTSRDDAERIAQVRDKAAIAGTSLVPSRFVVSARGSKFVIERRARSDWRLLDIL